MKSFAINKEKPRRVGNPGFGTKWVAASSGEIRYTRQLNVKITQEMYDALTQRIRLTEMSLAETVRKILLEYLSASCECDFLNTEIKHKKLADAITTDDQVNLI